MNKYIVEQTNTAIYKGQLVAVDRMSKQVVNLNRHDLLELIQVSGKQYLSLRSAK
jgi:predicted peroxiredoxin